MEYYNVIFKSLISSIGVIICLITFFYWIYKLKKDQKLSSKNFYLSIALILLSIWVNTFDDEFLYRLGGEKLYLTNRLWLDPSIIIAIITVTGTLTPIITILFIFYKSFNRKNIEIENQVDEFVKKLFTDDKFLTAFSTTLPKGKKDDDYGLDYIPFMLQSVENKRIRFKKFSNRFLSATLVLGISFISIVIFFGYILLNDNSIGLAKNVEDLKKEITVANANISLIDNKDSYETLINEYRVNFGIYDKLSVKNKQNQKVISSLKNHINKFSKDKNFDAFYSSFEMLKDSIDYDENFQNIIEQTNYKLEEYNLSKSLALSNYRYATKNLMSLIPKVENDIEKPQNQLHELLKRLILSVVIISFFLAILRYTAKLYLNNYNLMIQAENEDLAIRKFYVALKNTDKNQEERKLVIQKFLEIFNNNEVANSEINLSKEESGILKDLLNNLMKKL